MASLPFDKLILKVSNQAHCRESREVEVWVLVHVLLIKPLLTGTSSIIIMTLTLMIAFCILAAS